MSLFTIFNVYEKGTSLGRDLITVLDSEMANRKKWNNQLAFLNIIVPNTGHQDELRGLLLMLNYPEDILTFHNWTYGSKLLGLGEIIVLGPKDFISYRTDHPVLMEFK